MKNSFGRTDVKALNIVKVNYSPGLLQMKLIFPMAAKRFSSVKYSAKRRSAMKAFIALAVPPAGIALSMSSAKAEVLEEARGPETIMVNGWVLLRDDVSLLSN